MLIRHGEDEGQRDYHLSQRGQQRSEALPKLFGARLPKPDVIIASRATKGKQSSRRDRRASGQGTRCVDRPSSFETTISACSRKGFASGRAADGKDVLVCWHHGKLPKLAGTGRENPPVWPDDQFDRVWVIEPTKQSARFEDVHQKLLDGDR